MQNGLRDTDLRNPAATVESWLYSAVGATAVVPAKAAGRRNCPPVVPAPIPHYTEDRDLQGEEGERRDSNPRPPGPQPGSRSFQGMIDACNATGRRRLR
jgi:hypothetical protein